MLIIIIIIPVLPQKEKGKPQDFLLCCSKDTPQTPCWNSVDLTAKLSTTENERKSKTVTVTYTIPPDWLTVKFTK